MPKFWKAWRADLIESVYDREGDERDGVNVTLVSGRSGKAWGITARSAIAEIELLLADGERDERSEESALALRLAEREVARLEAQAAELRDSIDRLENQLNITFSIAGDKAKLMHLLSAVLTGKRTYLIASEKEAIKKLLEGE